MKGNDAHYTLVPFRKMCTVVSTTKPAAKVKTTRFSIRDIVPDDLIVKPVEQKPFPQIVKTSNRIVPSGFPNSNSVGTNNDEDANSSIVTKDNEQPSMKYPEDAVARPTIQEIPLELPDADTCFGLLLGSNEQIVFTAAGGSPGHTPLRKRKSYEVIKSLRPDLLDIKSPLFTPTETPAVGCCKEESKGKRSPKGCQISSAVEMDVTTYASAINDLAAAFGVTAIKVDARESLNDI
jgi:hypothetical protein